jgi:hypothetical protein
MLVLLFHRVFPSSATLSVYRTFLSVCAHTLFALYYTVLSPLHTHAQRKLTSLRRLTTVVVFSLWLSEVGHADRACVCVWSVCAASLSPPFFFLSLSVVHLKKKKNEANIHTNISFVADAHSNYHRITCEVAKLFFNDC